MDDKELPRINGKHFNDFLGRNVSLMCEAIGGPGQNGNCSVRTADGMTIQAALPVGERLDSIYMYLEGKVGANNTLQVSRVIPAGDSFDMGTYNKTLELARGKYSNLF